MKLWGKRLESVDGGEGFVPSRFRERGILWSSSDLAVFGDGNRRGRCRGGQGMTLRRVEFLCLYYCGQGPRDGVYGSSLATNVILWSARRGERGIVALDSARPRMRA